MRTASGLHPDSLRRLGGAIHGFAHRHETAATRTFTMEDRQKAARDGAALPDGSFPIYNAKDLKDAVADSGRAGHPSSAREHIIRRAKALGLVNELPEPWRDHGYAY